MTEPGDPVSRRYRSLAREEPPASLDAAILARARSAAAARPRSAARWMGPVSIAAVLVLGIGVALRMQLEQPGIETSEAPPPQSEYSLPAAPPEPAPEAARDAAAPAKQAPAQQGRMKEDKVANAPPKPQAKRRDAMPPAAGDVARNETQATARGEPNPFADAPVVMQQAPSGASTPATTAGAAPPPPAEVRSQAAEARAQAAEPRAKLSADAVRAPAPAAAPATPPALAVPAAPAASAPARPATRAAPAAAGAAAPQAKREAASDDTARLDLKKSLAETEADPDPVRELERIAKLREAGAQREADRALEAFRRRHPDFRIPEAMWERVKPR
jgi:hypothetical protein